jgi:hypothetical protein
MKFTVKLAAGITVILLLLPIVYVASSGPVFWFSAHLWERHQKAFPVADKYFSKAKEPEVRFDQMVQSFYDPMFPAAKFLGLERPVYAYLHLWNLFRMRTAHDHYFVMHLSRPTSSAHP